MAMKIIKQGIWIGWKVESNWADPFVFLSYIIIKPIAHVIIIGLIFLIGSDAAGFINDELFFYTFTGAVFFIYPITILITLGYLIHEDRAKYEVLKNIYIVPRAIKGYIIGRALASAINASISVIISIIIANLIFTNFGLALSIDPFNINYPLLALTLIIGVVAFSFMGMILTAINLLTYKLQYSLSEYTTGVLFLFSGVVFPPNVLPEPFASISYAFPSTHFLELIRLSLKGMFDINIFAYMIITTIITIIFADTLFNYADKRARRKGMIDRKAEY
ncbi:MAG: ABC transporter permease [Candidatus Nitrosothermus koennekii]|nr:MAG: ABC transporter permease [Candidatus Nitrosothermus koennekii]